MCNNKPSFFFLFYTVRQEMQPVMQNVYKKRKQVSTLSIAQEQLRKSAGKPQCKDGRESASVNPLTLGALSSIMSPNTASTKGWSQYYL